MRYARISLIVNWKDMHISVNFKWGDLRAPLSCLRVLSSEKKLLFTDFGFVFEQWRQLRAVSPAVFVVCFRCLFSLSCLVPYFLVSLVLLCTVFMCLVQFSRFCVVSCAVLFCPS